MIGQSQLLRRGCLGVDEMGWDHGGGSLERVEWRLYLLSYGAVHVVNIVSYPFPSRPAHCPILMRPLLSRHHLQTLLSCTVHLLQLSVDNMV